MLLVLGSLGAVNWSNTRDFLKHSQVNIQGWKDYLYQTSTKNFGAKAELAFTCPECQRVLPVIITDIDHISPKSQLTFQLVKHSNSIQQNGTLYSFPEIGWVSCIIAGELQVAYFEIENNCLCLNKNTGGTHKIKTSLKDLKNYHPANIMKELEIDETPDPNKEWFPPIPLQTAMENDLENLRLTCPGCNRSKSDKV